MEGLLVLSLFIFWGIDAVSSRGAVYTPPKVPQLTDRFSHVSVGQVFNESFGHQNINLIRNGSSVDLILDKSSGSGLVSKNKYYHGFFNVAVKLPSGFTSGIVVAFYLAYSGRGHKHVCIKYEEVKAQRLTRPVNIQLSNSDVFAHNHDEIDFELLGHEKRRDWVLQTNIYGNGSVHTGREEKFYLWFDPTQQFHHYSILWNSHHIVFLVDNVPVREVLDNDAISSAYPSKPMSVHATIWDASEWATHGGKYPVNYKYAPFVASLAEMEVEGCVWQPTGPASSCSKSGLSSLNPVEREEFAKLSEQQITGLEWSRRKLMFYSYCRDNSRYKVLPPECKR